jgi:hypothetical protein
MNPQGYVPRDCFDSCELFCDGANWKPLKNGVHNPQPHRQTLRHLLVCKIPINDTMELTFLAGVAVNMSLKRAWSCEALVTNLALVLLLGA